MINIIFVFLVLLSGCSNTIEKLKRIDKDPAIADLAIPDYETENDLINQSIVPEQNTHMQKTNSLWRPGSVKFFRDNRAWRVGDIIRVSVSIRDSAKLDNSTSNKRNSNNKMGLTSLFGTEKDLATILSKKANPASLLGNGSTSDHEGKGNISRNENIQTEIAALVRKVLPNGNLIIQGHQEVRVNSELREIKIAGIIRPKDISNTNSIKSDQIAEARISYGGRGIVSDIQNPPVGKQVIDVLSPF